MKKLIFTMALLLIATAGVQAQSGKPRLLIEDFTKAGSISGDNATKIRHAIIDALTKIQRFELVDAVTIAGLEPEMGKIQREMSDYIVNGTVLSMDVNEKVNEKGKTQYGCTLSYSLTVTDTKGQTTKGSKTIKETSNNHDTKEEAISSVADNLMKNVEVFCIEILPIKGTVNPFDYVAKENKLQKCYINIGSSIGAKKGDKFQVEEPTLRAGRIVYKKVGELEIEEIVDEELSYCKITDNHKNVLVAMEVFASLDEQGQEEKPLKITQIVSKNFINIDGVGEAAEGISTALKGLGGLFK